VCFHFFLKLLSETFLIVRRNERDLKNEWVFTSSTRYYYQILKKFELSRQIFEKYSNFKTIRPLGAALFHADGQTNMTKLIVAFRNFANAPKKTEHFTGNKPGHSYTCAPYVPEVPMYTDRHIDDRKRCMEGNMNYELEFVVLAYFKALFQPSRIGIRFKAGVRIFDTAFRQALVKVALFTRLIWPERKATHSLSFRVVITDLWSHFPHTSSSPCL